MRVSNIQLSIFRCLHAPFKDEDWRGSSVFHTYITYACKSYKMMMDENSYIYIILKNNCWENASQNRNPSTTIHYLGWQNHLIYYPIFFSAHLCPVIRTTFGVASWIWMPHIFCLAGHNYIIWMWQVLVGWIFTSSSSIQKW